MKCPRCSYERQPTDQAPAWQCPACGVAYAKATAPRNTPAPVTSEPDETEDDSPELTELEEHEARERLTAAARGQKILIFSILLNFGLRALEQTQALPDLVMYGLYLGVAAWSLLGVVKIGSGLGKSQNRKLLYMVLSFVP